MKCDRCGGDAGVSRCSWFNTQTICSKCAEVEENHPDFKYARAVEGEAIDRGEFNYPGVGWPGVDGRVPRPIDDRVVALEVRLECGDLEGDPSDLLASLETLRLAARDASDADNPLKGGDYLGPRSTDYWSSVEEAARLCREISELLTE